MFVTNQVVITTVLVALNAKSQQALSAARREIETDGGDGCGGSTGLGHAQHDDAHFRGPKVGRPEWPRDHRAGMGGGLAAEAVMAEARSHDCDQES